MNSEGVTTGFVFNDELALLEDCLTIIWTTAIEEAGKDRQGGAFRTILKLTKDVRYFDDFVEYYRLIFNSEAKARNYQDVVRSFAGKNSAEIEEILVGRFEKFKDTVEQSLLFNEDEDERRRVGRYARVMEKIYNCAIGSLRRSPIIIYDIEGWLKELSDDAM